MRKRYLFLLTLLFPLATMLKSGNVFAADPPQSEYEAALTAIKDGAYYLVTEVGETKWYVTQSGYLTDDKEMAYMFAISTVDASGAGDKLFDKAWLIEPNNGSHFSNTTLSGDKALLHPTETGYRQDGSNNRNDWERQIFYLNPETGKFAIRSCNTAFGESSWKDAGRAFWTWEVAESDDEYVAPTPCYSYDVAYIWSLEEAEGKEQLLMVLESIYNAYENEALDDVDEPEYVNMGTGFGQLADWETWRKFKGELDKVSTLLDKFLDEEYDPEADPDCPDVDASKAWKVEIDSMWQKILDSEVSYKIPQDGYYRIYTRLRYFQEETDPETGDVIDTKYIYKDILAPTTGDNAMFGTVRKDLANHIWKLTQVGDSVLMQNAGMESYVSLNASSRVTLTKDEALKSHVVFDYAGEDFIELADGDEDVRDVFNIRLAKNPRHDGYYVHQNGHSKGKDSGRDLELSFWYGTYGKALYDDDGGTSEYYLEPVAEEEVEELIKAFEPYAKHDVLVAQNNELRQKVADALEAAKDPIKTELIASADQLSSPNSDESEGTNIGNLLDGDVGTFWHTSWHGSNQEPQMAYKEGSYHYLEISGMENMIGNCNLYLRQRNGADYDHPSEVAIFGANDPEAADEEWALMATLTIPHVGVGEENNVLFNVTEAYPYLRLIVTQVKTKNGEAMDHRTYWHASEIQLTTIQDNPNSQFIALGEIATNLEKVYNENCAVSDDDLTPDMYDALLNAYQLFLGGMVDPTELRDALKKYAKTTEGVVEGTEPGQWASTDIAKAFDKLYNEAKTYNEGGKYDAVKIHKYAAMLKAMSKSVMEQANGLKTNTWYRIMFPTEEMYDKYGFDKSPADKTNLREDQATMWGTFATSGVELTEEEPAPTDEDPDAVANVNHLEAYERADVSDVTRMYFMAEDEIADKDVSKFRFVAREDENPDYYGLFDEVMGNSAVALDLSTTYTRGEALITEASQLSSNASDEAEGKDIGALIDGDKGTFWHSDWHQKVLAPHYLQVALNEPVSGLVQIDITRRNNDFGHIVHMFIQGSEDAESWTNIGYMSVPYGSPNEEVTTPAIDLGGSYKYLRFILTRRAGLEIEMDPFAEITNKNQYQVDYTYFHAAEFQIYPVKADKELSGNAKTLQETYNALHKVVNVYKDPTAEQFATAKQAYAAYQTEFNTAEGKAVLPEGADKPAPVYAIQNKATGLFIKPNDGNTNDIFLKPIPTFFSYKAPGYERSLLQGTNLNGNSTNYLHAGESNRRLCTWTSSEAYSNSALVIREAEAVEPAEFEFNLSIRTGEIYDFTSSVSITNKGDGVAYVGLGKYIDDNEETFLALKQVETIEAGQPAFYILEDTTMYSAEDEPILVKFTMPAEPDFKLEGDTINGFIACMINQPIGVNDIYFEANFATSIGKTGYSIVAPAVLVNQDLCPEVDPTAEYDFSICLNDADAVVGVKDVAATVKKIAQPGDVYSVDGKLLKTGATLNSLKSLGKGMYILNGVKVLVK